MIFAIIVGPIIAVQITKFIRRHQEQRDRKMYLFRTLMATRSATLAPAHIEALNLVEIEFHSNNHQDCKVVNAWKLYRAHLFDSNYPQESWDARRADLLVELLYEMSSELGYNYDKAHIKGGTYYPKTMVTLSLIKQKFVNCFLNYCEAIVHCLLVFQSLFNRSTTSPNRFRSWKVLKVKKLSN